MNLKIKIVFFLGFLVLIGIVLSKIANFQDYNPTVIIQANKFQNKEDNELLKGNKVNAEFKSNNNNLGIISVLFTTHSRINDDYLQFRIKEIGKSDWYYSNKYKVDQIQDYQYFPFGFPEINNSKNKTYQIEIESLNGTEGNSIKAINSVPFLSKYSFPKTYLLQNKNKIPQFLFDKTKSFFKNIGLVNYLYILIISITIWFFLTKKNIKRLSKYLVSDKFKFYASALCLLVVYNILTLTFAKQTLFSDEADNLLLGKMISSGLLIYKDFYSQHTPLMYYICAFIDWFGPNSIVIYRIYFFFLLSLIWIFIYIRYSKYFGKLAMALYPFIYIFSLGFTLFGNTILSEQIQSNALVILLLEFLLFGKRKLFKYDNYIIITIVIFFSIGTAFVSIFPVFVFLIGILFLDFYETFKNRTSFFPFFKRYVLLIIFISIPFLIMAIIYFNQGVLSNAFYQIFTFNTQVYSKYINYGTSFLGTFEKPIYLYSSFIIKVINNLFTTNLINNTQFLIGIISVFIFVCNLFKENKKVLGVFCFLFVLMCGTRGYDNFHSIPYYAMTAIIFSILTYNLVYLPYKKSNVYKNTSLVLMVSSIMILSTSFFSNYHVIGIKDFLKDKPLSTIESNILKITNKNDKIFINTDDVYSYIKTDRLPASRLYMLVPWFAEIYEDKVIEDLKINNPKVIVYNPELRFDIWGSRSKDFQVDFQSYIEKNYTLLNNEDKKCIEWIRNDYFKEASQKLIF